ncbi:MAG: 6-carboxy-5,6,7,8-tetrahydropterin synthase [Alphaproteobacteria bacterium BRH_c36]|nr:MAG: 6-carboxy-5,6,7,8-tetrahydropterin synthase [Alphaproteobacteria bacterium BRH_c36]
MRKNQPTARIARTYRFEAAHHLPLVPSTHKCHRMHGHNYRITVILRGQLDDRGLVTDFGELDDEIAPLLKQLDHELLNDVPGLENPTAELIAFWLLERLSHAVTIRVYENDDSWAEISRV